MKKLRFRHIPTIGEPHYVSPVMEFRNFYLKEGFELVDITKLCELKLGESGSCSDVNDPDDNIYHIQVWYRNEDIAVITPERGYVIDDEKYALFNTPDEDSDFIIFKLCSAEKMKSKTLKRIRKK